MTDHFHSPRFTTSPRSCASIRVRSTSEAGSGHPTTCLSAADIVAVLFFGEMRYDPKDPHNPDNDRFVLSKGHAAPILYAAWAEAGLFPREELLEAAPDRLGSGGTSDAAAAVRGRRHRIARPGYLRGDRHRAQRAAHRVRLPHLRAARRRRDGGGLGLGSGEPRAVTTSSTTCARSSTSTRLGQSQATQFGHDMDGDRARAGRRSAGTPSSSTGTTSRRCSRRSQRRARHQGPADHDPRAHAQGQRDLGDRGQGRLARQGAEEGEEADEAIAELEAQLVPAARAPRIESPKPACSRAGGARLLDACRRPPTRRATSSPRARRGAPAWLRSAASTSASSRSTLTSRTRPSATGSRRRIPNGSTNTSSPSRAWSARRWAWRRAARSRSRRRLPAS